MQVEFTSFDSYAETTLVYHNPDLIRAKLTPHIDRKSKKPE